MTINIELPAALRKAVRAEFSEKFLTGKTEYVVNQQSILPAIQQHPAAFGKVVTEFPQSAEVFRSHPIGIFYFQSAKAVFAVDDEINFNF